MMHTQKKTLTEKIKNFTMNFGPQLPAAHGVLNSQQIYKIKNNNYSFYQSSKFPLRFVIFEFIDNTAYQISSEEFYAFFQLSLIDKSQEKNLNKPYVNADDLPKLVWSTMLSNDSIISKKEQPQDVDLSQSQDLSAISFQDLHDFEGRLFYMRTTFTLSQQEFRENYCILAPHIEKTHPPMVDITELGTYRKFMCSETVYPIYETWKIY